METAALGLGKSVVGGALDFAKSAVAEEIALQSGVRSNLAFITGELEMMQSFLMAADEEVDKHKVLQTWVKQVRDVAYDVEDCLQDSVVHLEKSSWWCFPRLLRERHRIAIEMKFLRTRVEDVSQRNLRYHLIRMKGSASKSVTTSAEQFTAAAVGITEARRTAMLQDIPKVNLSQLISKEGEDLTVIAVWGTNGDLGKMPVIWQAYDDPEIKNKFAYRAWVRFTRPFKPSEFLQYSIRQFDCNSSDVPGRNQAEKTIVADAAKIGIMGQGLLDVFNRYVTEERYLIVIDDLSTIVEWETIKTYLPDSRKGSRIIVSTQQVEIANLCTGKPNQVSELKQVSSDQAVYAFYKDVLQPRISCTEHSSNSNASGASSNISTVPANRAEKDQSLGTSVRNGNSLADRHNKNGSRSESTEDFIGRGTEIRHLSSLISEVGDNRYVISVWGMGGLGKTTLVRNIYSSPDLCAAFQKRIWITISHPLNLKIFLRTLALHLQDDSPIGDENTFGMAESLIRKVSSMEIPNLINECRRLHGKKYLAVLDDLSSIAEWNMIKEYFPAEEKASRIIITTRYGSVAQHCSVAEKHRHNLEVLNDDAALDLFKMKVFNAEERPFFDTRPELMEQAKLIIQKSGGHPLAIVTVAGLLATKPKTAIEWMKFNEHITAELDINPKLEMIKTILTKSFDDLPFHLKPCFLYLSVFPEDYNIGRGRLVRRWTAEGYSREIRNKTGKEIGDGYLAELIERSMIQPSKSKGLIGGSAAIDYCNVHDLIRELSILKSTEDNHVVILDGNDSINNSDKIRHLAVSSSWNRDRNVFTSIPSFSRLRSLTVFGPWRSFFLSNKMRLLRVLDLEDAYGLRNKDMKRIGRLLHLKYLSLRGCRGIFLLPDTIGNLQQLETLDIRRTPISNLPMTIVKLRKLHYLRADAEVSAQAEATGYGCFHKIFDDSWLCSIYCCLLRCGPLCVGCCRPGTLLDEPTNYNDWLDTWKYVWCHKIPGGNVGGVKVPRGIGRMKSLRTLGVVNISGACGKATIRALTKLTQLRKLGVAGLNKKNSKGFCFAISSLAHLEYLSIRSPEASGLVHCLDEISSPPKKLQSLKIYGVLGELPGWIQELHNLTKLVLRTTLLRIDNMQMIGNLQNLAVLRLWSHCFGRSGCDFRFQAVTFPSLVLLDIGRDTADSIIFEKEAMPKLEKLNVHSGRKLSGLAFLPSLKEVEISKDPLHSKLLEDLKNQLSDNPNGPVLKVAG